MMRTLIALLSIAILCSCHRQEPPKPVAHLDMGTTYIDISDIPKGIDWVELTPQVLEQSKNEKTPIFAYLYLPGCEECDKLEKETFGDKVVVERINSTYIPVKIDLTYSLGLVCRLKLIAAPAMVIIPEPGQTDVVIQGAIPPNGLIEVLDTWEGVKLQKKVLAQGGTSG